MMWVLKVKTVHSNAKRKIFQFPIMFNSLQSMEKSDIIGIFTVTNILFFIREFLVCFLIGCVFDKRIY